MAKTRSSNFVCQNCGTSFVKWSGKCENCGEWNTLVEQKIDNSETQAKSAIAKGQVSGKILEFAGIKTIIPSDAKARLLTEFKDLNTVLGGGRGCREGMRRKLRLLGLLLPCMAEGNEDREVIQKDTKNKQVTVTCLFS